ncbi:MAG TPA: hypothetical protein VK158_03200 [Acidobacteriota bacterium]|nr:hypothetical protein [Acidobacteriota bacterium]
MNNRGQVWQVDFLIALFFVILIYIITYNYVTSLSPPTSLEDLSSDTFYASEILLGEGIPSDWNASNVIQAGLITDGELDRDKIDAFFAMAPTAQRILIGAESKYHITFYNQSNQLNFSGNSFIGTFPVNAKQSASVTRFAVLDGYVIKMQVTLWD